MGNYRCKERRRYTRKSHSVESLTVDVKIESLCLYPSSLPHYTRPFDAKENLIVLAFDMIPKR